ncbi:MAG: Sir2 family transcriptional regulator [Cyanobacteria bacterium PR.3.49]|nr:Sir2 family transcriptional regulator [Cyanobacteria bacterium PR.3.49]
MEIPMRDARNIVVFTGAGISACAGLRTYRGPDGLWNDAAIVKAAEAQTLNINPRFSWDHWGGMRAQIAAAQPTQAHLALAAAEASLPDGYSLNILTQNVDGLHTRAGSKNVIEFHGNVMKSRCTNPNCTIHPFEDHAPHAEALPLCASCGHHLRPDVVLFGENVEAAKAAAARKLMKECGTLLVVGTMLEVQPAKSIVDIKKRFYSGVKTIWVNITPAGQYHWSFKEVHTGGADKVVPELLARLIPGFLNQ